MKRMEADVAVIGSGAAGIMAAIEAQDRGARVILLGTGGVGKGTCTSMVGGIFAASSAHRSMDEHYRETVEAGRGLNTIGLVEAVIGCAGESMRRLQKMGVPLLENREGFMVDNRGNAREVPGIKLAEAMARLVAERPITAIDQFHCLDLVLEQGRISGVIGVDVQSNGEPTFIHAPAVVLATGGAAALYLRHDNPAGIMGEGYAMALRAGCQLQNMEFVQFYPYGVAEPGLPAAMIYPPYPEQARLLDVEGRDVLQALPGCRSLHDVIIRFRDKASLLFHRKHLEGGLFLDLSGVDENVWTSMNSLRLLARNKFDFHRRKLRIAPITHFSIGGVVVNERSETLVPGLFAAGEITGGFHGANRLGGNALTECIVCGCTAGVNAAGYARQAGPPEEGMTRAKELFPAWAGRKGQPPGTGYRRLLMKLKTCAWDFAGVIRSGDGMRTGLEQVSDLERESDALVSLGNDDGLRHTQVRSALLTLRCILEAGLHRKESRGAFFREDHPEPVDIRWRCNIRISLDRPSGRLVLQETPLGSG